MFVLDEEKLNLILTEMAEGLVRSPLEIALFAVLVFCIILPAVFLHRRQVHKVMDENLRRSLRLFKQGVRELGLGFCEVSLLESLAAWLKGSSQKYVLLESQTAFNSCARKLLDMGHASASEIAALRLKLGFTTPAPEQVFISSAQLCENMPVVLIVKERGQIRGTIREVKPHCLRVTLTESSTTGNTTLFPYGDLVKVLFQTPAGRFAFSSRVKRTEKGTVELAHSENISRLQRRQFYRRSIALPVNAKRVGAGQEIMRTMLFDLGGGGASLSNGVTHFSVGERISLSVVPAGHPRIDVIGKVIRVSKKDSIAHLRFDGISEADRDRIMGLLFKPKKTY
jgi:c-di-GMP-binding flagellar brake protein YcgR